MIHSMKRLNSLRNVLFHRLLPAQSAISAPSGHPGNYVRAYSVAPDHYEPVKNARTLQQSLWQLTLGLGAAVATVAACGLVQSSECEQHASSGQTKVVFRSPIPSTFLLCIIHCLATHWHPACRSLKVKAVQFFLRKRLLSMPQKTPVSGSHTKMGSTTSQTGYSNDWTCINMPYRMLHWTHDSLLDPIKTPDLHFSALQALTVTHVCITSML